MSDMNDELGRLMEPFPIRGEHLSDGRGFPDHTIPRLYAVWAFRSVLRHFGPIQTLDHVRDSGGFPWRKFMDYLCGGNGDMQAYTRCHYGEQSIKNQLPIIVPGTPEWDDEVRFMEDREREEARRRGRVVAGYGTTGDVWKKP